MKDVKFEIEFVTHCLATGGDPEQDLPDTFARDSSDHIIMQKTWFHSAFTRAIELARLQGQMKAEDIQIDPTITAETERYERRFDADAFRIHEAIPPGTKVSFEGMAEDNVDQKMLKAVLERMGKYVGLSPYGFRLGFGRFHVVSVEVQKD